MHSRRRKRTSSIGGIVGEARFCRRAEPCKRLASITFWVHFWEVLMNTNPKAPPRLLRGGFKAYLSVLLTLLFIISNVPAQSGTSSINGNVTDPQGKAVAGATVKLKNDATNFSRVQTTNESGGYTFTGIPPGNYVVEAEAAGFKKRVVNAVKALVDKPAEIDLQLEVGDVSESVTVSAGSSETLMNTQDASIGNNFINQQIVQLPLESRNVVQLLSLQPGVTPSGYVTGSRADQANVTLDGVDVNEQQTGLDIVDQLAFGRDTAFASVLRVTPDSIQEFRVTVTNPNASQGRSSGAQISLITKGGTNAFHGSLYEFHRNTVTTANDFFNNRSGVERPSLIRNLFGGSIGGPIKKDKLFFFFTYEGRRDATQTSVVQTVPLASLGRGEVAFPNSSGGVTRLSAAQVNSLFPAVGINPAAIAVLADAATRYPANDNSAGDGFNTGGFRFNAPTPLRWNTNIVRLDYSLNQNHLLFLRGNYQQDRISGAPAFPDTPIPVLLTHPVGIAAGDTWTINSKLVNNFRYGLTRESFTNVGDSTANDVNFRFVFDPRIPSYTLSRITPVHNFTDDLSWIKGSHSLQFGTNIRLIQNRRQTFGNSFDQAVINPSFYDFSGAVLTDPISGIADGFDSAVRTAVASVIGRFSQYSANFNFARDGSVLPVGSGIDRNFATQEYDGYVQDVWRAKQNLTLTLGLRYGVSRPVYETNGLQVKPTTSLNNYFEQRKASAAAGMPFNDPITVDLAGPANGRPGYYPWDLNNLQPRISLAWSPSFKTGFLHKLFGNEGDSVIRGGFAMINDHIGQQLAVQFDLNSTLGFSSNQTIAANTFNVTDRPGPRFTNFGQNVRTFPGISVPGQLIFPLVTPADEAQRIESSLDDKITTPTHYSWNVSFGRKLPAGLFVEAAYIGRKARNLLATRDIMALNDLVDSKSGVDWYHAAGMLTDLRAANTPISKVKNIPYFQNLFPHLADNLGLDPSLSSTQAAYQLVARDGVGGFDIVDYTFLQVILDDVGIVPNLFFQPQYAALATFSTVASSDYHAGTLSIRERYKDQLSIDFNYTLSKSIDDASGLQNSNVYGAAFILNPLRPHDNRAISDFDIRHIINASSVWQLPVGRGKHFLNKIPGLAEGLLGGWQLTSIFRWNSGLPVQTPFDDSRWATNWNVQSNAVRIASIQTSPTRGGAAAPNLFSDPLTAYRSFRNARAGETGDRNVLRLPGYVSMDMGLGKSFTMPYNENHKLQFRWEVFNLTNTQRLTLGPVTRDNLGIGEDAQLGTPGPAFGNLSQIQGTPRVMQFALRYSF